MMKDENKQKSKYSSTLSRYSKLHIKHMLLRKRPYARKNVVDIALLLDNNQYVEYTIPFRQDIFTFWVALRIKKFFIQYYIDEKTDVMVNQLLDEKHPVMMYLDIIHSHVPFKLRILSLDQIVSRINYYFTGKTAKKSKLNAVWEKTIKKKSCPWITQQVDYALQNKTPMTQRTMKLMRIAMFYMVVKNFLYQRSKRSKAKKANESIDSPEEVSSNVPST